MGKQSNYEKNPCDVADYYELDNFSKYGPGLHYQFIIYDEDIEKWLSAE